MGITPALIRISVGFERPDDVIADLRQALDWMQEARRRPRGISVNIARVQRGTDARKVGFDYSSQCCTRSWLAEHEQG